MQDIIHTIKNKIKWNKWSDWEQFAFGYFPIAYIAVVIPLTALFCWFR